MIRAILISLALFLAACGPDWQAPVSPPDGGRAPMPKGALVFCAENPDHWMCGHDPD